MSRLHASISWQQSRSQWLKEGDANTKYFHSVLAGRRRRNAISVIQVDGVSLEGVNPIRQAVFSHFASHFKNQNMERPGVENLQFKRLNHFECSSLIKPFTEAEVKSVVWDCDSFKSPGPDGINFGFFKDFWTELRGDVMRFISDFHRNGKLTKGINSTFIALIPKVDSPQRLNDFRPISLVSSIYKILAKVLANRLRLVIGSVISESQTTFVKDRQILDGILIANEVVDEARKSKKELMLFKVDFEKAYDSVDWSYLDKVMESMLFPTLWRKWIKECVGTATASILVNGSPTDEFPLERGLRQGDPLSPFLFLLAAEGLNVLMEAMVARNLFVGYSLGEVGKIPFLYLGLPIGGDSRRLGFWKSVLERLKNRLSGWKSRFLSFGGRLVLIKSVLTSLPIFLGGCEDFRKTAWVNWKTICLRKEYGGLGVRQLREFNVALLGKWCWRMLVDREGLWFRVLAARYGVERGRLRDGGRRGSLWWREIVSIRDGVAESGGGWFRENVVRKVGDGLDTLFWTDPWVDETPLCERFGRLFALSETKLLTVAEMFSLGWGMDGMAWVWRRQLRAWEEDMLRECQFLLANISLQAHHSDRWQWQPDPDTGYTVRGVYQLLTARDSVTMDDASHLIWHPQIPLKVSIFAWRLLRDRLSTKTNLVIRGIISSSAQVCVAGCGEAESAHHLFISCSFFGSLWALVCTWIDISLTDSSTIQEHFVHFTSSLGGSRARRSFLQLIWLVVEVKECYFGFKLP
ncbi:uncharacterized protein LOC123922923 [Trifolium pratense]|uniref:uncharacterized protein LOC123922923 n=1 Tax=Trifolium pratense TaxID=57577 RepID=UPI001E694445|nr:uncharacterized protein LOC123922923 [Trifolium pratense]